eukprot:927731-Amorphochlora_amoeboformis.AAC.1
MQCAMSPAHSYRPIPLSRPFIPYIVLSWPLIPYVVLSWAFPQRSPLWKWADDKAVHGEQGVADRVGYY